MGKKGGKWGYSERKGERVEVIIVRTKGERVGDKGTKGRIVKVEVKEMVSVLMTLFIFELMDLD